MELYLDHNLIADLTKGIAPLLQEKLDRVKRAGAHIAYSPAHIEEIAVIGRSCDEDRAEAFILAHLETLMNLSDGLEYLPPHNSGPSRKVIESPSECYFRVVENYNLTEIAESLSEFHGAMRNKTAFLKWAHSNGIEIHGAPLTHDNLREAHEIPQQGMSHISGEEVLRDPRVQPIIETKLRNQGLDIKELPRGSALLDDHHQRRRATDALMRVFEVVGFHPEGKGRHRSGMHDVTHAIYAANADLLVSNDARFVQKSSAIFRYLELPTRVLGLDEYLNQHG